MKKVGDLVLSKCPRIHGTGFGIIVSVHKRPNNRPPKFKVRWLESGENRFWILGVDLEQVA